jgi:prevent-host-death family protein
MRRIDNTYDMAYDISAKEITMTTLTASEARASLYRLIDEATLNHQPVLITGKRHNAVLVSADDWAAIQETIYLLSVPGMRESIREGLATSPDECSKELAW